MRSRSLFLILLAPALLAAQTRPAPRTDSPPAAARTPGRTAAAPNPLAPLGLLPALAVRRSVLSNGLRIAWVEERGLPLVHGRLLVRAGEALDPEEKRGLAVLTNMVLIQGGIASMRGDQLAKRFQELGAAVDASTGEVFAVIRFSCSSAVLDEVLGLLRQLLAEPVFPLSAAETAKARLHGRAAGRYASWSARAMAEFTRLAYGPEVPLGGQGGDARFAAFRRDDLLAFYRQHYYPANAALALWGGVDPETLPQQLESAFSSWKAVAAAARPLPNFELAPAAGVYFAETADPRQTYFVMGQLSGRLDSHEEAALRVAAEALGGANSQSRLRRRLMAEQDAAFTLAAEWRAGSQYPGLFHISGTLRPFRTTDALMAVQKEIEQMAAAPMAGQELENAQARVLRNLLVDYPTARELFFAETELELLGYPPSMMQRLQKAITGLTAEAVQQAVRKHWRTDRLIFIVLGNPRFYARPLDNLNRPMQKLEMGTGVPSPAQPAAGAESLARAAGLLQQARDATGLSKVAGAIRDFVELSDTLQLEGGVRHGFTVQRWIAPSLYRQDQSWPEGERSFFHDGTQGWVKLPHGLGQPSAYVTEQLRSSIFHLWFRLLAADADPALSVASPEPGVVEIRDSAGQHARLIFDAESHLPVMMSYERKEPSGIVTMLSEEFSDWTETGGLRWPSKVVARRDGVRSALQSVVEVKWNTGLLPEQIRDPGNRLGRDPAGLGKDGSPETGTTVKMFEVSQ